MKRAALLLMLAAGACTPIDNHLLEGQAYVATGQCLDPAQAIDDVSGPDPGTCAPTCLVTAQDGGPLVFITTTCGPYPSYFTSESQSAATGATDPCKGAFAAFASGAYCGPDGAAPPSDAAADAVPDSHADAGADGSPTGSSSDAKPPPDAEAGSDAPAGG